MRLPRLALALLALGAAAPLQAGPVLPGQWYTFGFWDVGDPLIGSAGFFAMEGTLPAPEGPWTFELTSPARLTVVDGFLSGDRFEIADAGTPIGTTSRPLPGGSCGTSLDCVLRDSRFSRGFFHLLPGLHALEGRVLASPYGSGAGAFAIHPIPAPAALPLLAGALALAALVLRRGRGRRGG